MYLLTDIPAYSIFTAYRCISTWQNNRKGPYSYVAKKEGKVSNFTKGLYNADCLKVSFLDLLKKT